MLAAAVALKVAVVAPAVTVAEAGTVSKALLLESATTEPPVGAAVFRVTVQLAMALGFRLPGVQVSAEMLGTVMIPLAPAETDSPSPIALTPVRLVIATVVVVALAASVSWTLPTTPDAIALVFDPVSRQVNTPVVDAQEMVLLAAVAAEPALIEMDETWAAG